MLIVPVAIVGIVVHRIEAPIYVGIGDIVLNAQTTNIA